MNAQFKLIVALCVASMAGTVVFFAFYIWKKEVLPEEKALQAIMQVQKAPPPKPDLGISRYQQAMKLISEGETAAAREDLKEILISYKDSSRYADARRVLGELNVGDYFPSEKDSGNAFSYHTVKRGDSLQKIATLNKCSLEYIVCVNQLTSSVIHPGDRLIVRPLLFEANIDLSDKLLTLKRNGEYVKEYRILRAPLPAIIKPPVTDAVMARSTAHLPDGKQIGLLKPGFAEASKWLHVRRDRQKTDAFLIVGGPAAGEGEISKEESGIVLSHPDVEELLLLMTNGTIVHLKQ